MIFGGPLVIVAVKAPASGRAPGARASHMNHARRRGRCRNMTVLPRSFPACMRGSMTHRRVSRSEPYGIVAVYVTRPLPVLVAPPPPYTPPGGKVLLAYEKVHFASALTM